MQPKTDQDIVKDTHNIARYFTEHRQVGWVLLVITIAWGMLGYVWMPKAKDPHIDVRVAAAVCVWPGAPAEKIEQLVTRRLESVVAENPFVETLESSTRGSVVVLYIILKEDVEDVGKVFDDIAIKLGKLNDLPEGVQPVQFIKDFGDTAAMLLTVASPKASDIELELRSKVIQKEIKKVRAEAENPEKRATIISIFPFDVNVQSFARLATTLAPELADLGRGRDFRFLSGEGFLGIDFEPADGATDEAIRTGLLALLRGRTRLSEIHPDIGALTIIRAPEDTLQKLKASAPDKYSYRQLDDFTDTLRRRLQAVPLVSKVSRAGVVPERIYLEYSQTRMASTGVKIASIDDILKARNIAVPGGIIEVDQKNVTIDPSGALKNERELGDVLVGTAASGVPIYLKDVVQIERGYDSPPRFLNFLTARGPDGKLMRHRAVTLALQMRKGGQIGTFAEEVGGALAEAQELLPEDVIVRRTSDQPLQVKENVALFMRSLLEGIILVVLVALIGFWEWRSAALMAISIPITLAMTFGMMSLLRLDIQQVSVASLILALGLLVDDPVVAGDAIKRSLADGFKPMVAAWLGPTKLATAILFATITNIVAYLPFLALSGDVGRFLYSLPVVLTCSLVASRLVSMSFIPLVGYYLLRPKAETEAGKVTIFSKYYTPIARWCLAHRKVVLGLSLIPLSLGLGSGLFLKPSFFPKDLSYLSYVDIWLAEDAPLSATQEVARQAENAIRETVAKFAKEEGVPEEEVLVSLTTFVGGGGPRFWYSVVPEQEQLNYAQIIIQVQNKHTTSHLVAPLQEALAAIPGARIDMRELENGKPVGRPVAVRISGDEISELRALAERTKKILRAAPGAARVRDDWGSDGLSVNLLIDPDRANFAGVTNLDVAFSSAVGMNGRPVGTLRDHDKQIPIITRMRPEERAQLEDVQNLYVYGREGQKVPLRQVARVGYSLGTEKIHRRNHARTITVSAFLEPDHLSSEVTAKVLPEIEKFKAQLPPGYRIEIGGEYEEQHKGFGELMLVLLISVVAIFVALVIQFKSAIKPLMVFASLPFGVAGAVSSVLVMGASFGFMAFLGVISLIGVIVSHIIVLFDLIEELREHGAPLEDALVSAAILRIRPVMITVGATVLGLVPLALHGGPLWEPLCYAQIGGLTVATVLTLVLVPVIYAVFVLDLRWVHWPPPKPIQQEPTIARRIPASMTQQIAARRPPIADPSEAADRTEMMPPVDFYKRIPPK
ncbi:MAG: efflux RND transporter permease subunit [Myxococcota bacterium]